MNRAARLLPPLRRQPLQSIATPSHLYRGLSTEQTRPRGPFSALWRTPQKPPSPFVSRPTLPSRSQPISESTAKVEEADEFHDREEPEVVDGEPAAEPTAAETDTFVSAEVDSEKTPGHEGIEAALEEAGAEGTEAIPKDAEYWDEKVEDFTTERADEIASMTLKFDEDLDPALKPWQKPLLPRAIRPGEPIVLPISSLGAPDPTAAVPSGLGISLPPQIFGVPVRRDILHYCVVWWRAGKRRGTHKNLGRSEVAFSGRKLRPQKKTGKARLGSAGSPMLRKGGRAHPKRPRDYSIELPRKVRAMGMRMALSAKLYMGTLRIVENLNEADWIRTKEAIAGLSGEVLRKKNKAAKAVAAEAVGSSTLPSTPPLAFAEDSDRLSILFLHPPNKPAGQIWDFARPLRNIPGIEVMSTDQVEVYHLLHYRWVVMEAGCVDALAQHAGQVEAVPVAFPNAAVEVPDQYAEPVQEAVEKTVEETSSDVGLVRAATFDPIHDLELEPPAQAETLSPMRPAHRWILDGWRKIRGRKSMRKTFGVNRADAYQRIAKRAWKKIRRSGKWATPERVAMEINAGKVGGKRALTAVKR